MLSLKFLRNNINLRAIISSRAFIFSIEALIALVLFVGFLQIAHFSAQEQNNYLKEIAIKNALSDALAEMDSTGFAAQTLDSNLLTPAQKVSALYSKIQNLLPPNISARVEVLSYDSNAVSCRETGLFDDCFTPLAPYPALGDALPTNKTLIHEKNIYVSRKGPQSCSIGALFEDARSKKYSKLFFSEQRIQKLFFASTPDLNINFGVSVSPSDRVSCDENIYVDLNASIPNDSVLYGRHPADIMLVLDRSGSMSWDGQLTLTSPRDIVISGNYAFVADGSAGLRDINILDPLNSSIVGTYNSPGTASGVAVVSNTAYLADGTSGLRIVNVTNKASPSSIGSLTTIGTAQKLGVRGNYAYVVTTTNGSADYTDLTVSASSNVDLNIGRASPNDLNAAQSFVPASNSIHSIDLWLRKVSNPNNAVTVRLRSTLTGADIATATIAANSIGTSYAWETATFATDVVVDPSQTYYIVATTSSTSASAYFLWGAQNTNPYASGTAYKGVSQLATTDAFFRTGHRARTGLQVIDISTPSAPVHKSSVLGTDPNDVNVLGNYAYFTDGTVGLKVIDISNPISPVVSGSIDTTDASGITVSGNYAYVADGSAGLRVIDVSNVSSPSITGTSNTSGTSQGVFLYSDGNVYVADNSALVGVSISNPSIPAQTSSYSTAYNYQRVGIVNDWAFVTAAGYNSLISFNIKNGPKMDQLKISANRFVDFNGWKEAYDQLGLVSFSTSAVIDQQLVRATDGNKTIIKNLVQALVASGSTAIGDAINSGRTELTSVRATPDDVKFEVLLSDGVSNSGADPLTAATAARDANIKIYTIGYGPDADSATLASIANTTGGTYYSANDLNALTEVFEFIAIDIGESLSGTTVYPVNDANIMIPVFNCSDFIDTNTGTCTNIGDSNYLDYNVGVIDKTHPWSSSFVLNIPCDSNTTCEIDSLVLPPAGTNFYWSDINHTPKPPIPWDTNQTLFFDYRDLALSVLDASALTQGAVSVDVNVFNNGKLPTSSTTLDFLLNDPITGTVLKTENVSALNPAQVKLFLNERLNAGGWIYINLNRNEDVRECPGNNIASVYCSASSKTEYYVINAWAWVE